MVEVISPVKAAYAHGDIVTVSIYRDSDEQAIVSGAACSEIGSTGIFLYQPVFTLPLAKTTYTVIFMNGVYTQTVELVLGGYDYLAYMRVPNGSSTYTDTVLDPLSNPIAGAQIEAYSDSDRTTLVDVKHTDINGVFMMHLNPGTYYCRAIQRGYIFPDWVKVVT
jgi:hypothetical protein